MADDPPARRQLCRIEVVDKGSGWPVPLVDLRTTHQVRYVTDNAGLIALDAPDLMGREIWFHVSGHGYEVPRDGFGFRGVRLTPELGKTLRIEVVRTSIAERIGRLTGAGLFAESQKLGLHLDWRDAGIFGCDSVQTAVHRGRLFWCWGDTSKANYPLGIFDSTSATTAAGPPTALEPPLKLKFEYFTDAKGLPRGVAKMPGQGPTWLTGYVSLPDKSGTPRLVASYAKITPPLDAYEWGLAVWNDADERFEPLREVWTKSEMSRDRPFLPRGHAVLWRDTEGTEWILFGNPFPTLRCLATFDAWSDETLWKEISPQKSLRAADDGKDVEPHSGSIAWNPWRKRWVTIFMQKFGTPSAFGEIWYAEADAPAGPWGPAVKVLSHDNYTFYNPRIHSEFTPSGSAYLYFEGTYTREFADHAQPTPRYDYNQILYRINLDDPALAKARDGGGDISRSTSHSRGD